MSSKPKLRPLDFQPITYEGEQMWHLRDPLRLSESQLVVPPALATLLQFLDGTRDEGEIYDAFCQLVGDQVDYEIITHTLAQLDEAFLLSNERATAAEAAQLDDFRTQPYRSPALAGLSYAANADELTDQLHAYGKGDSLDGWAAWSGRGIVSPHIDYARGGAVYAKVWRRAAKALADAELVLIFGTDHNGGDSLLTLTRQPYATPFGILPGARDMVETLADAYGPEAAFANELNHRDEHSIELSAVWLHHIFRELGRTPCPVVPILCGSFGYYLAEGRHPKNDEQLNRFLTTLQNVTAGKRVVAVASVDLAHVGPGFGDRFSMDPARRKRLVASDQELIAAINCGDHRRFFAAIDSVHDRNRICGFSSIYLLLRYLEQSGSAPLRGVEVAYDHCRADAQDASLVSICGLLLA